MNMQQRGAAAERLLLLAFPVLMNVTLQHTMQACAAYAAEASLLYHHTAAVSEVHVSICLSALPIPGH
jgi:hypothetical protein